MHYFNNIEKRAVIKFFFLRGKVPKEIHAILAETMACFLPGRAKDLLAPCTVSNAVVFVAYEISYNTYKKCEVKLILLYNKHTIYLMKSTHHIPKKNILHQFKNNVLIQLSSIK